MKPCPFCESSRVDVMHGAGSVLRGICLSCGVLGAPTESIDAAKQAWDRRPRINDNKAATEVDDRMIATVKNHARKEAALRHARAIIDLYDDGGVR